MSQHNSLVETDKPLVPLTPSLAHLNREHAVQRIRPKPQLNLRRLEALTV